MSSSHPHTLRAPGYRLVLGIATILALLTVAARAQAAQYVYVAKAGSNDVSQYSVGAGGRLDPLSPATVATGSTPSGVAVSPDGESVYVTNSAGTVSQYDVDGIGRLTPKATAQLPTGVAPSGLAVSPDGKSVYVTNAGDDTVSQYKVGVGGGLSPKNPATIVAGTDPSSVAVSPNGKGVYVTNAHGQPPDIGNVSQYNSGGLSLTPKTPATVETRGWPTAVVVNPDGKSVYVVTSYYGTGEVLRYDVGPGGGLVSGPYSAGPIPGYRRGLFDLAVSPDGKSAYVTAWPTYAGEDPPRGGLVQYDVGAGGRLSPKSPLEVAGSPYETGIGVVVGTDGRSVYLTSASGVSQFDVGAGGRLSPKDPVTLATGGNPGAIAVNPGPSTASVRVSGKTLIVTAAEGTKDNVAISRPSPSTLRVTNSPSGPYTGSSLPTGAGCTPSGFYAANCHGEIARIQVAAGDQADRVVNSTGVQSSLYGGTGTDVLSGGFHQDALYGGPNPDVIRGMNGNDQLFARDLTSDTTINCDGGIGTPGHADKADLDKLPMDPNSVVKGCESRVRH